MNKLLRNLLALTGLVLLPGLTQTVFASHFMGGEIIYQTVAPGVYVVQAKVYRDCTGATAPMSITLDLKPQGCSGGRSLTVPRTGNPTIGDPYCPSVPKTCSATGMPNYEEVRFVITVTLTAAEQACPGGIVISSTNSSRPQVSNLVNPQGNMYFEAFINTAAGINNNSPEFSPLNVPVPFFCVGQKITYSINAAEMDGDSLVYSLKTPLSAAATPYQYGSYGVATIYNSDSSKYTIAPAGTFSATYPFPSFEVDWTQPMPLTPVKTFYIDPVNGVLRFTPTHYTANSPSVQGLNKFTMVVQIDEYRKINGVATKVGHIRRDILANMVYCGGNVSPAITGPTANGAQLNDTSVIYLKPNYQLTLQFNTTDPNTADVVSVSSDVQNVLTGSTETYSAGNRPTGTITWMPTTSDVRTKPYFFSVRIKDNACPISASGIRTFAVRVSNTGGVTGTSEEISGNAAFVAYPNPFRNEVSFKLNQVKAAQTIVIYNALGQKIDQISLSSLPAENTSVKWNNASKFAAGSYVARLISAEKTVQTVKFSKLQ